MPYTKGNAPAHIPEQELVENLLSVERDDPAENALKPLQDLTDDERKRFNLVKLGQRARSIQGDPYGMWQHWAGNVNHPEDESIFTVLEPLLDQLIAIDMKENEDVTAVRNLLEMIPFHDPVDICTRLANEPTPSTLVQNEEQTTACFNLRKFTVRITKAKDLDVRQVKTYHNSPRAKAAAEKEEKILGEEQMPLFVQQYLMARVLHDRPAEYQQRAKKADARRLASGQPKERRTAENSVFAELRGLAREKYWLQMTKEQRAQLRKVAETLSSDPSLDEALCPALATIKANWYDTFWRNNHNDPDYFENFLRDQAAAASVWPLKSEDVVIVVDKNRKVVMANVEKLCQILFGDEAHDLLDRIIDLWSFYCPMPLPATKRHVVDGFVRRQHPELDPALATIEGLMNAKMAVAHYGCWALQNDPQGRDIRPTLDTRFGRSSQNTYDTWYLQKLLPKFSRAVFGKASAMIRFMLKPLDKDYYQECVEIFQNLPEDARMSVDEEDFLSLFVLGINGYTQRHKDTGDVKGGCAGLVTLGRYKGANLCVPQLDLKVQYTPGSCAVIRGNGLDHLVEDFKPPRWFIIGTNHEPVKRHAWRKLGREPPLPERVRGTKRKLEEEDKSAEEVRKRNGEETLGSTGPCVQWGGDDDGDELELSDEKLHGPGALPLEGQGIDPNLVG